MHDHKLITGLVTHLQPAIHRISFNMQHENPLKQEILREYQFNKFRELFKENKAIDLVDYQDQNYKIILDKGVKLSLRPIYLIAPKYNTKLQNYI